MPTRPTFQINFMSFVDFKAKIGIAGVTPLGIFRIFQNYPSAPCFKPAAYRSY
jgi:hypothetical protein